MIRTQKETRGYSQRVLVLLELSIHVQNVVIKKKEAAHMDL